MNNQICYRMLYESDKISIEKLRECYIETYKNPKYTTHSDLKQVILDSGLLSKKQFNKILIDFLNNSSNELVTIEEESTETGNEAIESDIRETNRAMLEVQKMKEQKDLMVKQSTLTDEQETKLKENEKLETEIQKSGITSDGENQELIVTDEKSSSAEQTNEKSSSAELTDEKSASAELSGEQTFEPKDLILGNCVIKKRIGEGNIGQVWLGSHNKLGFDIAVKILNKKSASNKKMLKRFYVEGNLASNLNHNNIIHVYEISEFAGFHYIVMQYVDGLNVKDYMIEKKPSLKQILHIILQTLDGLYYAHKKDIIHRDIKLENLMINSDNIVKITDFGFSKQIGHSNITVSGDVFGTPYYMPPEQWEDSHTTDQQADIYATGVCMYKLISGKYPIDGETPVNIFKRMMSGKRANIRTYVPDIEFELEQIIETAIALRRENRFSSALEFGRKIAEYATIKNWTDIIPWIFSKEAYDEAKFKETQELKKAKKEKPKMKNVKLIKNFDKTLLVYCDSKIDGNFLNEIEEFITKLIKRDKVDYVIFEMAKVLKLTSLGFATILRLNDMLKRKEGSVYVLKPTKQASIMLNMMAVDSVLPIFQKITDLKTHIEQEKAETDNE